MKPFTMEAVHAPEACPHCGAPAKPRLMVAHIQATVAAYYRIPIRYMTSDHRDWEVSHPRQVAMYLACELTPKSYPDIGRRFGNRDHTTVLHARKAVKKRMSADLELAEDVQALRERLSQNSHLIHSQKEPKSATFALVSDTEQSVKTQGKMAA